MSPVKLRAVPFLLLLGIGTSAFGQMFAPEGGRWYVTHTRDYSPGVLVPPYFVYEVSGYTSIEGQEVAIIDAFSDQGVPLGKRFFIHEDSNRVYFYQNAEFVLLYDFNLVPGDTLNFDIPDLWKEYLDYYHYLNLESCHGGFRSVITAVDSIIIDGESLLRMRTEGIYDLETECCVELGDIIERIGSLWSIFGGSCVVHAAVAPGYVRCYEDQDIQYYSWGTCDFFIEYPLANPGSMWYFEDYSEDCTASSYIRIVVSDEINDNSTRIVEVFENGSLEPRASVTMRQDFDRIGFEEGGHIKLLYDFGLNAGDTMTFQVPRNRHLFDIYCRDSSAIHPEYFALVDSVAARTIDGVELRELHTSPIGTDCIDLGIVVERIGSEYGLFGRLCQDCDFGCPGHFRCYSDDQIILMVSPEACDSTTATGNITLAPDLQIFPNPAIDFLMIESQQLSKVNRICAIDLVGRVSALQVSGNITISHLPAGVYLLVLELTGGRQVAKRFIKL